MKLATEYVGLEIRDEQEDVAVADAQVMHGYSVGLQFERLEEFKWFEFRKLSHDKPLAEVELAHLLHQQSTMRIAAQAL